MGSEVKHTLGPYFWREFAQDTVDLEQMRKLGMTPTRLLTNEGQIPLMAGEGHDVKRIALIDCQTNYKRGQGYKTACAERDANATLFAAAPGLVKALEFIRDGYANQDVNHVDYRVKVYQVALDALASLASPPPDLGGQS